MMLAVLLACSITVAYGLPADPVIQKLDEIRYQYMPGPDGTAHLVDTWVKVSDLKASARFDPDRENVYHLFTRQNPSVSQPMIFGNAGLATNFKSGRRTIVIVHGWTNHAQSPVNAVLVPAFLSAEDVNVIVADWSVGAAPTYPIAVLNTITSGRAMARFISWLNQVTGADIDTYHLVGHSLGGHQVGIIGRNLAGRVPYITALDLASPAWNTNQHRFTSTDGVYTESIHTSAGILGYLLPAADSSFYPNGGSNMPGCDTHWCDHNRCIFYLAESITSGGFNSWRCSSVLQALDGNCTEEGLPMGGLQPKTRSSGIFYLETEAAPPFSRGKDHTL